MPTAPSGSQLHALLRAPFVLLSKSLHLYLLRKYESYILDLKISVVAARKPDQGRMEEHLREGKLGRTSKDNFFLLWSPALTTKGSLGCHSLHFQR